MEFMKEFKIKRGETVEFSNGLKLTFESHSHKMVMAGGPKSPLILYVSYEYNEKKEEEVQYNLDPEPDQKWGWRWESFTFFVNDYQYDEYMKLQVVYEPGKKYESGEF